MSNSWRLRRTVVVAVQGRRGRAERPPVRSAEDGGRGGLAGVAHEVGVVVGLFAAGVSGRRCRELLRVVGRSPLDAWAGPQVGRLGEGGRGLAIVRLGRRRRGGGAVISPPWHAQVEGLPVRCRRGSGRRGHAALGHRQTLLGHLGGRLRVLKDGVDGGGDVGVAAAAARDQVGGAGARGQGGRGGLGELLLDSPRLWRAASRSSSWC